MVSHPPTHQTNKHKATDNRYIFAKRRARALREAQCKEKTKNGI